MRRPVLLLACLLALASGVALIGAGLTLDVPVRGTEPVGRPSADGGANAPLVRRFYAAVNTGLETGDPSSLTALLAADFVDRTVSPGRDATAEGLVQHVLVLRATFPGLWLTVEEMHAGADRVFATVRMEGSDPGVFLGLSFAGKSASWAQLDVFRVAGGRIAERWAAGDEPVPPQTLVRMPLADPPTEADVRLARLTFAPGARAPEAGMRGPLILAVETGTLTVTAFGGALLARAEGAAGADSIATPLPQGAVVTLGPGDGLSLPPAAHYAFRNTAPSPAVALALALLPAAGPSADPAGIRWPGAGSPDLVVQHLAEAFVTGLPAGAAEVALGRLTLGPGVALEVNGRAGPRLVGVETGTLRLATDFGSSVTLSAGQWARPDPAFVSTVSNAGDRPLVVLVGSITPSGAATAWR